MLRAVEIAVLICLSYSIVAINTIAISKRNYRWTGVSSVLWLIVNFFVVKHIAEANSARELVGYVLGGVSGDFLGIFISNKFNL